MAGQWLSDQLIAGIGVTDWGLGSGLGRRVPSSECRGPSAQCPGPNRNFQEARRPDSQYRGFRHSSETLVIQRLSHTGIYVLDQDAAKDFYVNKLGFEVKVDHTMDNGFRWLTVAPKGQPDL